MPLFEYHCPSCTKQFETLVREDTVPACPSCGATELDKLLSAFAVSAKSSAGPSLGPAPGGCGSCGDPRGPGACSLN